MKIRVYEAEVVEQLLYDLKDEYTKLMKKRMDDNDIDGINGASRVITALGILEDRILSLPLKEVDMK